MKVREACLADAEELAHLRWEYSPEQVARGVQTLAEFRREFVAFIEASLSGGKGKIWCLDSGTGLRGNLYLQVIAKVPRPGEFANRWGYATNVYVEPTFQNQGWGGQMIEAAVAWAKAEGLEFIILWPSSESVGFYEDHGFIRSPDAMERHF